MTTLDGKPLVLSDYKRKPVVLVFGSFTCPTFRALAPRLEELRNAYRRKIGFIVCYTREAHALGEWEVQRNRDENIRIDQPADLAGRTRLATMTRTGLKLDGDWGVDAMTDATTTAYDAMPDGAVVIDAEGKIALVQHWADPHAIDRVLKELTSERRRVR